MSRLSGRATLWSSVLCLSFACSEEAPGTAVDPSTSGTGGTGSSTGGLSTTTGATTQTSTNAGQTSDKTTSGSGTSSGGNQTSANTTSTPSTSGTATSNASTSGSATTATTATSSTVSEGEVSSDESTASEDNSSDTGASDLSSTSATSDATATSSGGSTSSTQETTDDGTSMGGTIPSGDCTPDPSGDFVTEGEVVFDAKTCLSWMKADVNGHPYAAADTYCADLNLGGHDDWRLPTAGEATTLFHCEGTFPPVYDVFTATYDGIWTTTETGTIAGDEPKVCGAGQASGQFYDFGKVGAQNTRCVRGPVTVPDREDCKTNNQVCQ